MEYRMGYIDHGIHLTLNLTSNLILTLPMGYVVWTTG